MKINHNWIYPVAGVIVAMALILTLIFLCGKERSEGVPEETEVPTTEAITPNESTDSSQVQEPDTTDDSKDATEETYERNPIHLVDFDEGNEVYLDMDVIATLAEMEAEGEEDLVNDILLGEIQTINYFAKAGYSHRAICQAQRFYFDFYDAVGEMEFEAFAEKLSACIPAEGATLEGFAERVQEVFGWGENMDFSYVTEVEVNS
jgi:hypothetical protein